MLLKKKWLYQLILVIAVFLFAYFAVFYEKISVGDRIPNFTVYDLSYNRVPSSDIIKGVTLINFWGNWCGVCLKELGDFKALFERLPGLKIVAIHAGASPEDKNAILNLIAAKGINYDVFMDKGPVQDDFGVGIVPVTYILSKDGVVLDKRVGGFNVLDENYLARVKTFLSK